MRNFSKVGVLLALTLAGLAGCQKKTTMGQAQKDALRESEAPAGFRTGFPTWADTPELVLLPVTDSESPLPTGVSISSAIILAYFTGNTSYDAGKSIGFDTIEYTEIARSGGMITLTLLPDGRYRLYTFNVFSSFGLTNKEVTREVGNFVLAGDQLTLTPVWSRSDDSNSSGQLTATLQPLTSRTYAVTLASFSKPAGTPQTNTGYILRGGCPAFILPDTCTSASTSELRLQAMRIQ